MKYLNNLKLSSKTNFGIIVTFIFIAFIFIIIEIPVQQNRLEQSMYRSRILLRTLVERDKQPLATEMFDRQNRAVEMRLNQMLEIDDVLSINVYDESGNIFETQGIFKTNDNLKIEEMISPEENISITKKDGENLIVYFQEIIIIGERIGFIKIFYSINSIINEQLFFILVNLILLFLIFLIMLVFLNFILKRTIINPLMFLRDAMQKINIDNLGGTVEIKNNDEIGDLTGTFNKMSLELHRSYREIEYNKKYFNNLFNSLNSVLITVDKSGAIKHWNKAAEIFFEIPSITTLNKKLWILLPMFKEYKKNITKVIKSGEIINLYKIKTGKNKYLNISFEPLVFQNKTELVIVIDDVTEIEQKENQFRQTQKMEMIGTLAGGLSHDFNNILEGLIGAVTILEMKIEKGKEIKSDFLKKYIGLMKDATLRATDIVNRLSGLSRKQELVFIAIDLNDSIKNIIKIAENSFDKSVKINSEYLDTPAIINADPTQVEQSILNVCINSLHAMTIMRKNNEKWGGNLDIVINRINADKKFCKNFAGARPGNYLCISISDNGIGMDDKIIKDIFTPFFTTKEKGSGTGLGLSMVYNTIQLHQGFINVYSKTGMGTTFNLYFPEHAVQEKSVIKEIEFDKDFFYKGCILLIDDEESIHEIIVGMVEDYGLSVISAMDGKTGIELFNKNINDIDIIILDMAMPGLSGKEIYKKIIKIKPDVKVLLASGYKQDKRVSETIKLGVNGFIQKPFTLKALITSLAKLLEKDKKLKN